METNVQSYSDDEAVRAALADADWPPAIDPEFILDPNSEPEKTERAAAVVENFMDFEWSTRRFLEFGCSEGHIVREVANRGAATAVGYDLVPASITVGPNGLLTTNRNAVEARRPYHAILAFDVLDHLIGEEPEAALHWLASLLAPDGKVYVRCHPWCSRHGTHLYPVPNKAYVHLIFPEAQLARLGMQGTPTRRVIHPQAEYQGWFRRAGLRVLNWSVAIQRLEPFWSHRYARPIQEHWRSSPDPELASGRTFPTLQLEQQYLDYVLTL